MATINILTGAEFDAMPYEAGRRWELQDGELSPVSSATLQHQEIVIEILTAIRRYLAQNKMGRASTDVEFALTDRDRFRPDVCVLLKEKAARPDLTRIPLPFAPDIAIKVISGSEPAWASQNKVRTYLRHGTVEVWQVYPESRTVLVHRGETARVVEWSQPLETDLLPGFSVNLETPLA